MRECKRAHVHVRVCILRCVTLAIQSATRHCSSAHGMTTARGKRRISEDLSHQNSRTCMFWCERILPGLGIPHYEQHVDHKK